MRIFKDDRNLFTFRFAQVMGGMLVEERMYMLASLTAVLATSPWYHASVLGQVGPWVLVSTSNNFVADVDDPDYYNSAVKPDYTLMTFEEAQAFVVTNLATDSSFVLSEWLRYVQTMPNEKLEVKL